MGAQLCRDGEAEGPSHPTRGARFGQAVQAVKGRR